MAFSSNNTRSYELPYENDKSNKCNFTSLVYDCLAALRSKINLQSTESIESELKAFIAYAVAYPYTFFALIDTYDVIRYIFLKKPN